VQSFLKEPVAAHAYTRARYTNISEKHFTWRGEQSDDGKTWSEFMVVEVYRSECNVLTDVACDMRDRISCAFSPSPSRDSGPNRA
jgi:hypothetical protein